MKEFRFTVRCGKQTYYETVYSTDKETAWGDIHNIERYYQTNYGYKPRIMSVTEITAEP
jgi:hypothetical protein